VDRLLSGGTTVQQHGAHSGSTAPFAAPTLEQLEQEDAAVDQQNEDV